MRICAQSLTMGVTVHRCAELCGLRSRQDVCCRPTPRAVWPPTRSLLGPCGAFDGSWSARPGAAAAAKESPIVPSSMPVAALEGLEGAFAACEPRFTYSLKVDLMLIESV